MAQKRMFSLSVVDTDKFLEMPVSARLLYYELGMRADDDGFIDNYKKILSFTGLKEDDLKILIMKNFVIPFDSGVIVIKHWRLNNYLRNDRFTPTIYQNEFKNLKLNNNVYTLDTTGIPPGIPSIVENSIEKNSIDKYSVVEEEKEEEKKSATPPSDLFKAIEASFGRPISSAEYEVITTWEDNELTRYAIKQAELARAFNVKYIAKILYSYQKDNIKTVAEAEEREKNFQESKTTGFKSKREKVKNNVQAIKEKIEREQKL